MMNVHQENMLKSRGFCIATVELGQIYIYCKKINAYIRTRHGIKEAYQSDLFDMNPIPPFVQVDILMLKKCSLTWA